VANAADIIVNLVAKTGSFQRGMDKAGKKMSSFQRKALAMAKNVARLAVRFAKLAAIIAVVGFAKLVQGAIQANDELGKVSTLLGIATERMKGLQLAAVLAGATTSGFNKAILKMGKAVIDAANGLTTYTRIFDRLNITTAELLELSPDEQLLKIGKALSGIKSATERAAIGYDLFGGRNAILVNLLANTSDQIEDTIQKAQDLGAALAGADIALFEAAQDELTLIKTSFEGIRNAIVIDVLPAITLLSEFIQGVAIDINAAEDDTDSWVLSFVRTIGVIRGIVEALSNVLRALNIISSAIISFLLEPLAKVEEGWRLLADLIPGIEIDTTQTGIGNLIKGLDRTREIQIDLLTASRGYKGTVEDTVKAWEEAKKRAEAAAKVIEDQRAALRKTSAELAKVIEQRAEEARILAASLADQKKRQNELNQILLAGQTKSEQIAAKINKLNAALISGEFIKTEKERNAILERRAMLVADLIDAQRTEAGLATAADRARTLASVLGKVRKESVRVAQEIAVVNEALIKGEGDRNLLLEARKLLIEELIQAQIDEQSEVGKITEVGLQALRNMQDIMADFFANTEGGFRGLLSGFTDMLRRMVAQLLARRVLLSFLGLFAGGTGSTASFAQQAIKGITSRQGGGPLAAGQPSIVGEAGPELFIPKRAGTIVPGGRGAQVNIFQTNSFEGSGPLEPATLIPLLEENNRKLKAEFVDELRRGTFS
jgi:hypothetical protein